MEEESPLPLDQLVLSNRPLEEGSIAEGKIVRVTKNEVFVDIDYKSEGILPLSEFTDAGGNVNVKVGDALRVLIVRLEDRYGFVNISKAEADQMMGWTKVEEAMERKDLLNVRAIKTVKGGLLVALNGLTAFLPASQLAQRVPDPAKLEELVGQTLPVRVIKVNKLKASVIVSQRSSFRDDRGVKRQELWQQLKEGQQMKGVVKTIVPYGAFVDIGGLDGLLHMNDMNWSRLSSPEDMVSLGQEIDVVVLKVDRKANRVSLGMKQLTADPWVGIAEKYPQGKVVQGKVVNLVEYGAFVKLEEGIEGLVHVSEMSWTKRPKHPSQMVAIGDTTEAVVLSVDPMARRLSLGIKQLEEDPWGGIEERFPVGACVRGTVKNFADFGAFVELSDGIVGLLHASDISWIKRVANPAEALKRGDKMELEVLKIDKEHKRIALGLKQLSPDPWLEEIPKRYLVGSLVKGRVMKLTNFGAFVELEDGVEGLLHVSEVVMEPSQKCEEVLSTGQEFELVVIKVDVPGRKLGLSQKALTAGLLE